MSDAGTARVLIVDYAGHPFQYELATQLARNGHSIVHTYCSTTLTPQTGFTPTDGVTVEPIGVGRRFSKYDLRRRVVDELRYGWRTVSVARRAAPDRLLTSNVPLLSLLLLWSWSMISRTPWTLWLQDVQSGLAAMVAGGRGLSWRLVSILERFLIRRAGRIVVISAELRDEAIRMGAVPDRVEIVENWAPLADLPTRPKRNPWSVEHRLDDRFVFLYSGTLAKKHAPEMLLALADEFLPDDHVRIVVVAEGSGADWLSEQAACRRLPNLLQLPFQPFESLPDVLASADVLVALLNADAGAYSVPSKALTYLCAGRTVLASIPSGNAAAGTISQRAGAGLTVPPGDERAFRLAARQLEGDPAARTRFGRAARTYAQDNFDIDRVAARFEEILALAPRHPDARADRG